MSKPHRQHPVPMAREIGIHHYCCYKCRTFICLHNDIVSRTYKSSNRRAYLFSHATNITLGPQAERMLITGMHTIANAFCEECGELLGWKYYKAKDDRNKFKEVMFVIEKFKVDMEAW